MLMLMNHVVAAAAGLVLDQSSFFSTLLKKLILPPMISHFSRNVVGPRGAKRGGARENS